MQKTLRFLIAVVAMAGLASCASDEPVVPADGDAEHFSISIPSEVISRGFADGSSAKNIYVAVYPADDNSAVPCISNFKSHPVNNELVGGSAKVTDRTADMSITLVKGKSYNVFFLAESYLDNADDCPYTFNPSERTISVDYSKMVCNSDAPDAFYYYGKIIASGANHEIKLHRPLAQINIGTDDYQAASMSGLTVKTSAVTFSNLANTFNFTNGSATDELKDVTLKADIPTSDESFPVGEDNKYRYLNMAYVLVDSPAEGNGLIDNIMLSVNGKVAYSPYSNIPVCRNYRTNIYGSLLTNQQSFTVTMTEYNNDDINQEQPEFATVTSDKELLAAVEAQKNIRFGEDIKFYSKIDVTFNYPVIIDLNGHNISHEIPPKNPQAYYITITNSAGNKMTIQGEGSISSSKKLFVNNGDLIIKGGILQSDLDIITNNNGASCTIEGGKFLSNVPNYYIVYNFGSLTIKDGTFISKKNSIISVQADAKATISSGKFYGENHAIAIQSGGIASISGGYFSSKENSATIYNGYGDKGIVYISGGYFTNLYKKNNTPSDPWKPILGYQSTSVNIQKTIEGIQCIYNYQVVPKPSTGK